MAESQPVISVAVMAHPKRERFVPPLVSRLDREPTVVWDEKDSRWDTGRRALLTYSPDATHHLVVQDDALVPRDLVAGVVEALEYVPDDSPLSLYVGRVKPHAQRIQPVIQKTKRMSWLVMNKLLWGVGIVLPTGQIDSVVKWCDKGVLPNYDKRISLWYEREGLDVWYSWPSLVDHRPVRENPSLVEGRTSDRRAYRFIGQGRSALKVNWDGPTVRLEV